MTHPETGHEYARCMVCGKHGHEIDEYRDAVTVMGGQPHLESCDQFVMSDEGTYNHEKHSFVCTECYIEIGMPAYGLDTPYMWIAPFGHEEWAAFETKPHGAELQAYGKKRRGK